MRLVAFVATSLILMLLIAGALLLIPVDQSLQRADAWLVDFNYPEQGSASSVSFSRSRSSAFLPEVPLARAKLLLHVRSPLPLPPRPLTIGYNEQEVARVTVGDQARVLQLLLPTAAEAQTHGLAISLSTAGVMVAGDSRDLGLLFYEAATEPLDMAASSNRGPLNRVRISAALVALALIVAGGGWFWWRRWMRTEVVSVYHVTWTKEGLLLASLAALCVTYTVVISYYSIAKHALFHSNTYDLGQYNQVLWLISRSQYPYSTAQGVHILGNHASLLLYPLAMLYWIAPDVRALLIVQSLVVALGAVPLFLIGRGRGSPRLGLLVAFAYLLHPATQNMTLFDFHPDTFAATALLFALWSAEQRRWIAMFVCCAVVLAAKENFALTIACLGLWLALGQREWVRGGLLSTLGVGWFLFTTQVVLPHFNGKGQSVHLLERYAQYGGSVSAIAATFLTHPSLLLAPIVQPESLMYLWALVAPFALLCLFSPQILVLALPALVLNLLSSFEAQRTLVFHYSALIVAIMAVATLHTLLAIRERLPSRRVASGAVAIWLAAGVLYGQTTAELRVPEVQAWIDAPSARLRYYDYLLSLVPPAASIAAQTTIQPHVAERTQAFLFPNPFQQAVFVNPQQMPYTASVDYIMFDTRRTDSLYVPSSQQLDLLRALQDRRLYTPVARLDGIVLLRRSSAPLPADCFGARWQVLECSP